jgi:tRNA(adenine34) deaminase
MHEPVTAAPAQHHPRPDPVRDRWREPMRAAMAEAALAPATGDVPVGALVYGPDGELIGRGHNEREAVGDPTAHAEVLAIRQAAERVGEWRLSGCTLVVTLEPCTMCAGAIVLSRLRRVVYGAVAEKAGAAGSLWDVIRDRRLNHRPEVVHGVLAEDCAAQLTAFFDDRRDQHPDPREPFWD